MEVITIDSEAFKVLSKKIDKIASYVKEVMEDKDTSQEEKWLDSHEVSRMLNISTKTLQRLRKDRLISYTILRGRCIYRLSDIEKGLNERLIHAKNQDEISEE